MTIVEKCFMGVWRARARQRDVFHFHFLDRRLLLPSTLKDVIAPLSQSDTVHDKKNSLLVERVQCMDFTSYWNGHPNRYLNLQHYISESARVHPYTINMRNTIIQNIVLYMQKDVWKICLTLTCPQCVFSSLLTGISWDVLAGHWCLGSLCDLTINDAFSCLHSSARGEYEGSQPRASSMVDLTFNLHNRPTFQNIQEGRFDFFMELPWWLALQYILFSMDMDVSLSSNY